MINILRNENYKTTVGLFNLIKILVGLPILYFLLLVKGKISQPSVSLRTPDLRNQRSRV
jgi:hypothetical protein